MSPYDTVPIITSEVGTLREVLVHPPGRELEMVTPRNFGRMLMEDILYLPTAQEDHRELVAILRHVGVRVYRVRDLLYEMLLGFSESQRRAFVDEILNLEGCHVAYQRRMHRMTPEGLTEVCIEGELQPESLTRFLRQDIYSLPPISNLIFVRDGAAIVNHWVVLSTMARSVRARESLLYEWIFRNHPLFRREGTPFWLWLAELEARRRRYLEVQGSTGMAHLTLEGANFRFQGVKGFSVGGQEFAPVKALITSDDVIVEADDLKLSVGQRFVLEAGNLFVLSEDTLLIGCNQRATPNAIDALAQEMLEQRSRIKTILVAVFAPQSQFYTHHLDSGFGILYQDQERLECLVHQPMVEPQGAHVTMVRMTLERGHIRVVALPDLRTALEQICPQVHFIPCGSDARERVEERIYQEREWHNQAPNILALAPGKVVAFRRNRRTIELLKAAGYEEIPASSPDGLGGFLSWTQAEVAAWFGNKQRKSVITMRDEELSRAHGGPRSLVLPLRRDPV